MWGLYNLVCEGSTGRYEVAKKMLSILNLENKITVKEVSSEYFKQEYFAPRPPSERLINKRLTLRGMNRMRNWETCLQEYLNQAYGDFL